MRRRAIIQALAVGAAVTAWIGVPGLVGCVQTRPPAHEASVLLVTIDTLRADRVGCYGYDRARTPNLDRLAEEGVLFERARTHVPLTLPAHATILTGLLPPRHGVRGNGVFALDEGVPTLAEGFRSAGYATAAVVASVVLDRAYGLGRGFDVYDDNQRVGERAAFDYLERGASQVADSVGAILQTLDPPFFLWVHLYDPHLPWIAPPGFGGAGVDPYDAEIAFADAAFGEIRRRAAARAAGPMVVAVVSDHGESLGEHGENQHGYTLHRGVLRVPLLLAGPGIEAGRRIGDDVGLVDLAPTLAGLTGVPLPAGDGVSLAGSWSDGGAGEPRAIWEETLHPLYDSGWAPLRGLLTDEWHVVDAPRPELYDRKSDPGDTVNLASTRAVELQRLTTRLREMADALGDVAEPDPTVEDSPEQRERLEALASLGYVSGGMGQDRAGPRLDPKDGLPGFLALERADELLDGGDAAEAAALIEPFAERDRSNPRLWHQLGRARMLAGELEGAREALSRAASLAPHREFVQYTHAALLRRTGDVAGERAVLEALLAGNPRAVDAALRLAELAGREGDSERAERLLLEAHRAGARDPDLFTLLGHRARERDDGEAAARFYAEAIALHPSHAEARLALGRMALARGDAAAALEHLGRCVGGSAELECRVELARALVVGPRDLAGARRELLAARALAGDDPGRVGPIDRRLEVLGSMRP